MAEASKGFIKVEAVNICNTLLDTNQLSVVRGGSFALKKLIELIELKLVEAQSVDFESITVGSSTGVFSCPIESVAQVRQIIHDFLDNPVTIKGITLTPNELFTFVVNDVVAKNYSQAKEQLFALGRFEQAASMSFALPNLTTGDNVCSLNGYLPANSHNNKIRAAKNGLVCRSVDCRYQLGRKVRSDIYKEEQLALSSKLRDANQQVVETSSSTLEYQFPTDLEALAGKHPEMAISGKVAVIYADGNAFGKAQKAVISRADNQIEAQQKFDLELRASRANYLTSLVAFLVERGATIEEDGNTTVQLETLLWGGDEMTLVVPAWIGMATLQHFFQAHQNYTICQQPLTYSAGIVFCSHKTPIRQAESAARALADNIKQLPNGRKQNYFDYMVLESIDYPTESLEAFWTAQYGAAIAAERQPLMFNPNADFEQLAVAQSLENLPRSGVYKMLDAALKHQVTHIEAAKDCVKQDLAELKGKAAELPLIRKRLFDLGGESLSDAIANLTQIFHKKCNQQDTQPLLFDDHSTLFWLHMLELYDYLAPITPSKGGN